MYEGEMGNARKGTCGKLGPQEKKVLAAQHVLAKTQLAAKKKKCQLAIRREKIGIFSHFLEMWCGPLFCKMWKKHTFFAGGICGKVSRSRRSKIEDVFQLGHKLWLANKKGENTALSCKTGKQCFWGAREVVERTAMDAFFSTANIYCSSHLPYTVLLVFFNRSYIERCDSCRRLQNQGRERMTHAGGERGVRFTRTGSVQKVCGGILQSFW